MSGADSFTVPADLPEQLRIWETYQQRVSWQRAVEKGADAGPAQGALAGLPELTAIDALKANREAVDRLVGRRWYVMREAREAGETWETIGAALGITKQGAQDYYRRQIERQELFVPELHDAGRARAAL